MKSTMTNGEDSDLSSRPITLCSDCQSGVMQLHYLTYFTWLNDELITVPNFPAWVCNVCGRRENDHRAVLWLNSLLSPETGHRAPRPVRRTPSKDDRPQP